MMKPAVGVALKRVRTSVSRWIAGGLLVLQSTCLFAAEKSFILEEVIVTAQKRAESLQETPISLATFDSEQLEKDSISNLMDIKASVPSMSIEPFPIDMSNLRFFIRGVGTTDSQVTQDPSVGVYLDGVYIARSTGLALDLAELERIEVLRGPQGTLYGRNAVGGAVNLITVRPDPEAFGLKQKVTVGNRNLLTSKTSVNVPVGERAAVKLAYLTTERDGFVENTGPGADWGDKDVEGYRLDVGWDPTDNFQVAYGYDFSDMTFVNYTYQPIRPKPFIGGTSTGAVITDGINREARPFLPYTFEDRRLSKLNAPAPLEASFNEVEGHMLALTWGLGETELKYTAAYRTLLNSSYSDLSAGSSSPELRLDSNSYTTHDGTMSFPSIPGLLDQEQWSHELNLSGLVLSSRLEYIAGLYYFEEKADRDFTPLHHLLNALFRNQTDPATGISSKSNILALSAQRRTIDNDAWALYGRLTWTPAVLQDRLHLTFGARHSEDGRKATNFRDSRTLVESWTEDPNGNVISGTTTQLSAASFDAAGDKDFRDDSFEFIVGYDFSDDLNIYAKAVEAYKSGGFNVREIDEEFFSRGFDEEKALSYEIGLKSELLDRRLRVNADVFFTEFTNKQVNILLPDSFTDTRVFNAGESEISGGEAEVTFLAARELLFKLSYAYLEAEITKVTNPFTGEDQSDNFIFQQAPRHTFTLSMDWTVANWSWGRLGLNASYNYVDEREGNVVTRNSEHVVLDSFDLFNARLGLYNMPLFDGQLNVAVWGKNLEDKDYVVSAINVLPYAERAVTWGEPLSYGIDLIYNY